MSIVRCAAVLGVLVLVGCSANSPRAVATSADPSIAREQQAVDALNLKQRYKDIVMGSEVKGTTLVVYIDVNNLYSMDESSEDALRSQTLAQWKRIWSAAHPKQHKLLRVSFRDYYGNEVVGNSTRG
jgi:hypothetical protein